MKNNMALTLVVFLGMTILFMFLKGTEVIPFALGGIAAIIISFALKYRRTKKYGTPETDERIQKNQKNAALKTLYILIGLGVIVLIVLTLGNQSYISVDAIWVALLAAIIILSVVLNIVKRK